MPISICHFLPRYDTKGGVLLVEKFISSKKISKRTSSQQRPCRTWISQRQGSVHSMLNFNYNLKASRLASFLYSRWKCILISLINCYQYYFSHLCQLKESIYAETLSPWHCSSLQFLIFCLVMVATRKCAFTPLYKTQSLVLALFKSYSKFPLFHLYWYYYVAHVYRATEPVNGLFKFQIKLMISS